MMDNAEQKDLGQDGSGEKKFPIWIMVLFLLGGLVVARISFIKMVPKEKAVHAAVYDQSRIAAPASEDTRKNALPEKKAADEVEPAAVPSKESAAASMGKMSDDEIHNDVRGFLHSWATAWENSAGRSGDFKTFLSFYGSDFQSENGLNREAWGRDKKRKNQRKDWIKISLSGLKFSKTANENIIRVAFLQKYDSSNYADSSQKVLTLAYDGGSTAEKNDGSWKVISVETLPDLTR